MTQQRAYGQFCGLARGLEIAGERWALLIVRDLLVGPRRYTDLRRGLPRIPTNILAARLKELEAAGVVERTVLPRPAGSVVYRLTEYGADLEPVVIALSRWGARALGEPREEEIVTPASMIMAMRTTFRAERAEGVTVDYELRMGEIALHLRVEDGALAAAEGPSPEPDLVIEAGPAIRALMAREVTPKEAIADGSVAVTGDPALLDRFVELFAI
ncbi:winged helix-turn-helix transcriptional regulator [Cryptosporangium aurantiacum]|uniref:Transcriptional regulator, HxlR family n=1 Tax=Cryptosporangium aurantiacum TaxID=134849 RepID=A0A1M7RM02_9ACTN|nr:winged helix-turn-helix transcriptional regulator [Cryptosporangium aurantiacum]SHN47343.1 transcriptional regulator, HxlR family [Cryptosporangium aurantiacum]